MPSPLYFDPDPEVQDSDLLGLGSLIYDDGHSEFVQDPEIASMFPRYDAAANQNQGLQDPNTGELMQPDPNVLGQGMAGDAMDAMGGAADSAWQAQQDIFAGKPPPGQAPDDGGFKPLPSVPGMEGNLDGEVRPAQGGGAQQQPEDGGFKPLASAPHLEADLNGNVRPAGEQPPTSGYGSGGLQLAQRSGALPQDMANEQLGAMQSQNQVELQATQNARDQQYATYDQYFGQRKAELDAEKAHQEGLIQEQQEKQLRLQKQQELTSNMKIETDLVSAQGWAGGIFSVLGAALLGATGSDAGLRMIDSAIDQHVKVQINERDSKLRILADQLGSTEQAITAGKSALYRTLIDRSQTMLELTKNDAFNKQTPAIIEGLKSKYLEQEQKFEQQSLGTPIEKAPVAPKPVAPGQVAKYGEAAAGQQKGQADALRLMHAIGGQYDPGTGKITNAAEILKEGIPGVGLADSAAHDMGGGSFLGRIVTATDNAMTSKKGLEVRAASEALINAEAIRQNPGRAPTDADRDSARNSLGMTTEEGVIRALERALSGQQTTKAQNVATYGAGAAAQYEGTMGAMGQSPQQLRTSPGAVRPLTPGNARQQVQDELGPTKTDQGAVDTMGEPTGDTDPMGQITGALQHAAGDELGPDGVVILAAQAAHETGEGKSLSGGNNFFGIKGAGKELETTEGEGANAKRVKSSFKTYADADASAADMVSLLKRKYPDAWEALKVGDVDTYVSELKRGGYFTANETAYLNGVKRFL